MEDFVEAQAPVTALALRRVRLDLWQTYAKILRTQMRCQDNAVGHIGTVPCNLGKQCAVRSPPVVHFVQTAQAHALDRLSAIRAFLLPPLYRSSKLTSEPCPAILPAERCHLELSFRKSAAVAVGKLGIPASFNMFNSCVEHLLPVCSMGCSNQLAESRLREV